MNTFFSKPKYFILTGCILFFSMISVAQKQAAYQMFVDGVKVIVQPSNNEIVEIETIIKGGVQNYDFNKQGIENLALNALTECGTNNDNKNSFKNKLDNVSAQINAHTDMDFATINMNCIKMDFETVWPLYVDAITAPKFDKTEFNRIKQDAINSLKENQSQPDFAIDKLARETAFKGKNYSKDPQGTETIVSTLTAAQTKTYYQSILTKSKLLIIVVAEIDKEILIAKIKKMLSLIPQGQPFEFKKDAYAPTKNSFASEKREVATNYLHGITSAPTPGTSEYSAYRIAMRIFSEKHFLEVRTNNGLSYAPGAWLSPGATTSANISVSTTNPNKYIDVVNNLVAKIKKNGFDAEDVKNTKTTYLTGFYYSQETNGAQASSLAANEIWLNDWKKALTLNEDLKKVSLTDVNNAFNKYFTNITWAYQGDINKVDAKLYTNAVKPNQPLPKPIFKEKVKN